MDLFLGIGIVGMSLILVGFLLINTHKLTADALWYDVLNCIGSTMLVISAIPARMWPFIILNSVFAMYSLKDIIFQDLPTTHKVLRKA